MAKHLGAGQPVAADPALTPALTYVICTAPRTGSTLLASALRSTGVAGKPAEYFDIHPHHEDHWRQSLGITSEAEYLAKVVAEGSTPNGVCGLKLHWHQIPALRPRLGLEPGADLPHMADAVDGALRQRLGPVRYLWLRRRDLVAQGVSYCLASMTNEWRRVRGKGAKPGTQDIAFDYRQLDWHVRLVESYEAGWVDFFRRLRIPALVLIYEDFVPSYERTVRGVLRYLDLPTDAIVAPPLLDRQADDRSQDWAERYRRERAGQQPGVPARPRGPRTPAAPVAPTPTDAAPRRRRRETPAGPDLPLIAYDIPGGNPRPLAVAPVGRAWMDATPRRFAYRCLPMLIANQAGWLVLSPQRLAVTWDGTQPATGLAIESPDGPHELLATSHFGSGVLTFHLGYLFRTPPGWNLHARGPANMPKDGIAALEGVIESDWSESTFTMNWKLTRPNHTVMFEKDEPICMVVPVRRGDVERFSPEIRSLADEPALAESFRRWSASRTSFNAGLKVDGSDARKEGWQRHYQKGRTITAAAAPEHQTALSVRVFEDKRKASPD